MGVLTSGRDGWLGKRFDEWRVRHGYQRGMVWNPWATTVCRLPECKTGRGKGNVHGAYEWPPK